MRSPRTPRIGHNSVQVPHNGKLSPAECGDMEVVWRRMERDLARRERFRLIKQGRIIPAYKMPPQMMILNSEGAWVPEIKVVEHASTA